MYETHFKLHALPLALTPDPGFLYGSQQHRLDLSMLRYGVAYGLQHDGRDDAALTEQAIASRVDVGLLPEFGGAARGRWTTAAPVD
jgi:hypothetical protein